MFRCKSIVIYSQRIRDNQARLVLFTEEFWKITTWYKKKDIPEAGTIIEALIERKWDINNLLRIDLTVLCREDGWTYEQVFYLLSLLESLYRWLPEWVSHKWVFEDTEMCLRYLIQNEEKSQLMILTHTRIMKSLWYLKDILYREDPLLSYIYTHIDTKPLSALIQSKKLGQTNLEVIRRSLEEARQNILIQSL